MATTFMHTCCRCMWPFGGSRALAYFSDKKNEDHDEEEAHHLLGNVIDSDDEQVQADALSPDQIKRFLDASKSSRSAVSSRPRESRMQGGASALAHRTAASKPAPVGEYDELFDEELEDEPETLGAKPWTGRWDDDPASFSPVETGGRGLGFGRGDARPQKPLLNGKARPLVGSPTTREGSRQNDDEEDEDDEEVAGPPIMLPSSPSFLPDFRQSQPQHGHLSGRQALSFPSGSAHRESDPVTCLSRERPEASGMLEAWDGDSIVLDGDAGHFVEALVSAPQPLPQVPEATAVAG
ncbi:unnamed protein product [Durusdinium trenchii]|uniref:Uncharacterized protein n=2 Tax=Durusdinium trenchii TaxID=1381693 RepID=A0ABP0Q2K0_9DINO